MLGRYYTPSQYERVFKSLRNFGMVFVVKVFDKRRED